MEFIQNTLFGKMSAEPSPQTKERTSEQYSKASVKSQTKPYLSLNLTNGHPLGASWEMVTPSHGESWMHNIGESPSVAVESFLWQVLENHRQPISCLEKYYLSPKACAGVLGRAERMGKQLPEILKTALEQQIIRLESDAENPGGGKGALIQENKAGTLATNNDQTLFQKICLNNQGGSVMVISENVTGTLRAQMGGHSPIILDKPMCYCVDQGGGKSGANVSENISPTLTTTHQGEPAVCYGVDVYNQSITGSKSHCMRNKAADADHIPCVCYGINGEKAGTLDASYYKGCGERQGVERDAVAYSVENHPNDSHVKIDEEGKVQALTSRMGTGGNNVPLVMDSKTVGVLCARDYKGACNQWVDEDKFIVQSPQYIVRRLTPIECARLQGFPDWWCSGLESYPTEEDIDWWYEVFETHRKAMGKSTKPKSRKRIEKWLRDPYSDTAAYKMWGNGVALPCVYYVLKGIVCQDR